MGKGKRGAYYLVHGDLPRQHPFGTTLRFILLALHRRSLGSERHRYAIAWPDKLGTDPMADAAAELGRNPLIIVKHEVQPEYVCGDDEQADAGRECRPV